MSKDVDPRLVEITDCLYRVSSKAVVVRDNTLLLVREEQGWYGVPGGGVEYGQDIRESLVREIEEELGVDISINDIPTTPILISNEGVFDGIPRVTIYYHVLLNTQKLNTVSELEHRWVTRKELESIELAPNIAVSRNELSQILA